MIVSAPDFGTRYYTFSVNQADLSSEQSLCPRTHGGQLPPLFVHGPGWHGAVPKDMVDVPSSTRYTNLAGRILVQSPAEYDDVHALQDRLAIVRWADWRKGKRLPVLHAQQRDLSQGPEHATANVVLMSRLGSELQDWAVRPQDRTMLAEPERLGISRACGFQPDLLSPAQSAVIKRGFDRAREDVRLASLRLGVERNGSTTNYRGPRFGSDVMLRAAVARDQIFVAVPEEAVYPIARVDAEGRKLDGGFCFRIRFATGRLPPVDAFWSITVYDDTDFIIPNTANRYLVGDRTPGLIKDADGGITIEVGAQEPANSENANWLPMAEGAPFYLMMRLYRPRAEVLDRTWVPPAIVRVGD